MNLNDINEQLGAAAAVILAFAVAARKWLRSDRAEVASEKSYGLALTNMREEIERLARLNSTLHAKIIEYQKETLDLHDKLEKIGMEMISMEQENEEMKNEIRSIRDRIHMMFHSCGNCARFGTVANWPSQ